MNTDSWLEGLGLSQYARLFCDNDLDWDALPYLEDADLREIGITSLGHRKKLARAIALLQDTASEQTAARGGDGTTPRESERRQVSVMFCDLVGSTSLSTRLDAEEMDAVVRRYQETVTPTVQKFGGHVARFSGDGILSYFGYPDAIEQEAELAVRAALEACQRVAAAEFHPGIQSHVRIGIATGDVVVGGVYDRGTFYEAMVTGETPNLAARLQGVAEPGTVAICDTTRALAGGLFNFDDNGARTLQGFDREVQTWLVTGHSGTEDRYMATRARQSAGSMVGRQRESSILLTGWRRAQDGKGSTIVIEGEAGVGKSRLFDNLCRSLRQDEASQVRLYCTQFARSTPLFPLVSFLNSEIGADREQDNALRMERLRDYLGQNYPARAELYPILCRLLAIEDPEAESQLRGMSPQRIREQTLEAGIAMITDASTTNPLLVFVEDVHWADPTTRQLLRRLVTGIVGLPALLVMTTRPDAGQDWESAALTRLDLSRLSDDQLVEVVRDLAGQSPLPEAVVAQVVAKSDGIPLFAEELTKSLLAHYESATGDAMTVDAEEPSIPTALQSGLMLRLDRLGDAREFVLTSAVIGREFTLDLAAAVAGLPMDAAAELIGQLCDAGIFRQLPGYQPPLYSFSHALLREAAYGNLLRSRRRQIHREVAEVLQTRFPQTATNEPERLARHFSSAEQYDQAIGYRLQAGQRALAESANQEAVDHLQRGLALLQHLSDPALQIGLELQLQMTLAPALIQLKGFAADEVREVFSRSRKLCESLGASAKLFPVIRGLISFYTVGADYEAAIALGRELEAVLAEDDNTGNRLEHAWVLGSAYLFSGDIASAMPLFERGRELYQPDLHSAHTLLYGQDPGVANLTHYIVGLNLQGRYAESVALEQQVLARLDELKHPFTRAQAMGFLQSTSYLRGDRERVLQLASQSLAFCQEQGFPVFMAMAMVYQGWALTLGGDESGTELLRNGIAVYEMSGAQTSKPSFLVVLADAYMASGDMARALAAIEEANLAICQTGEKLFLPAVHRFRAEILLGTDADTTTLREALGDLQGAIAAARDAGSRHYEVECLTTAVKVLQALGEDVEDALDQLLAVYRDLSGSSDNVATRSALATLTGAGRVP